jgi:putative spermidine/putrescine transport system ATP-binding protein
MNVPSDVELVAVTKRYGAVVAVDAIDMTILQDTYYCLLRPSGCRHCTPKTPSLLASPLA